MPLSAKLSRYEKSVYTVLCIGIVYSLIFWTLLNSILCLTLSAYWLFFSRKEFTWKSFRGRLILLFASIYLLTVIGALYTANKDEGLFRIQQKVTLLAFPIIFGTTRWLTPSLLKKIFVHFLLGTTIACVISLGYRFFQYLQTGDFKLMTKFNLIIFPDMYPFTLGLFCLMSIIFLFQLIPGSSKKWKVWLILAGLLLSLVILLLSVRVIFTCWLLLLIFYVFRLIKKPAHQILGLAGLGVIAIIAVFTITPLKNQWKEIIDIPEKQEIPLDQDASLNREWGGKSIRFAIWKCSEEIIRNHWLTGVGTGDIQDSLQATYEKRKFFFASRYNRYNAHNQYLQFFIGHGFLGPLLLLGCILIPLFYYRSFATQPIYLLFLLIFSIICFSEVILDVNKGVIWYSFFNSIFAFNLPKPRISLPDK